MPTFHHFLQCLLLVHLALLCSFVNLTSAQIINIGDWISDLEDGEASSTFVPTAASTTATDTSATGPTIYKTTYQARYKHILDEGCEGPNPEILIYCETGQLEMLEASDDSIFCMGPLAINGSTAALCRNDCVGAECESVYVDVGFTSLDLYGEITFACSGPDVNDVKANIYIEGSDSGSCPAGTESGFNLLFASMGVLCNDDGNNNGNEFVFDDLHAECTGGNPFTFTNDDYQCLSGDVCGTSACSVTIDNISISADHFRFAESCIESSDGSAIPEIDMPTSEPIPTGSYSTIFSTNLQVFVGQFLTDDDCNVHTSGLTVTCLNGDIVLFEAPDFFTCQVSSNGDAIDCVEANSVVGTPVNQWGYLVYKCTSINEIPTAIAELAEVETTCTASSNLQLGALCGDPGEQGFLYVDFIVECGEGNDFDTMDRNYTCSESQAVSSFASEPGLIPEVSIYTDYRWSLLTEDICFEFKQDSTGAGPAGTPTTSPAPTPAPQATTPRPTSRPTAFPTATPTTFPTAGESVTNPRTESPTTSLDIVSPTASPTATPTTTTTTTTATTEEPTLSPVSDTSPVSTSAPTTLITTTVPVPVNREISNGGGGGGGDSDSDSTGIIIGVVVAVVAVLAIVGVAAFVLHKRNQNKKNAAAATVHKDDGNDDEEKGPETCKPPYGGMQAQQPTQSPPYGDMQQDGRQVLASYSLSPAEPKPEPGMTRPPPSFPFAAVTQNDNTDSSRSPTVPAAAAAAASAPAPAPQEQPARRQSQNYYHKNKATPYDRVQVNPNDGALPTAAAVPMVVDDTPMHPPNEGYFDAKNQLFDDSNLGATAIADDDNDDDISC